MELVRFSLIGRMRRRNDYFPKPDSFVTATSANVRREGEPKEMN